jgi:hypothetical protein
LFHHSGGIYEPSLANIDDMSVLEKLDMWKIYTPESGQEMGVDQQLEVSSESGEGDTNSHSEFNAYGKMIFESEAYNWLISSLKKICVLHFPSVQTQDNLYTIRRKILTKFSPGMMGSKCRIKEACVTFQIPWSPLSNYLKNGNGCLLSELITMTSSSMEIQVANTQDFFAQTWTSNGSSLLSVLQSAINGAHTTVQKREFHSREADYPANY